MKNNQILAVLNGKIKKGGGGEPVDAYTKTQTDNLLLNKVDKEEGKGLFSGSYNDLTDKPSIPTKTSDLENDNNYATNESVDELNSNLDGLQYSDVAGGKNLVLNTVYGYIAIDKKINIDNESTSYIFYAQAGKTYSFSSDATPTAQGVRFAKVSSISPETQEVVSDYNVIADGVSTFTTNETGYYMLYAYNTKTSGIKFQIEEGTTATEYEPYIPSVKMLAEEQTKQNDSLGSQGLLNVFDNKFESGGMDGDGTEWSNTNFLRSVNYFKCGKTVTIKCNKNHSQLVVTFYNESGNGLGNVMLTNVSNGIFNAPSGSTKFRIQVADENITSQTVGEVLVYADNEISQLKNDLSELCNIKKTFTNADTTYTYTASEMHLENDHIYDVFLKGNYPTAGCGCCRVFVKNNQYILFTIGANYIEFAMSSSDGTLTVTNKYNGTQGTELIVKKVV